jgi:hypothetical protein
MTVGEAIVSVRRPSRGFGTGAAPGGARPSVAAIGGDYPRSGNVFGVWWAKRRAEDSSSGATTIDPLVPNGHDGEVDLDTLKSEIDRLAQANLASPDRETERRLLKLSHRAGIALQEEAPDEPQFVAADVDALPAGNPLPEIAAADRSEAGKRIKPGYYEEFEAEPGSGEPVVRGWIAQGGGVLAADSPRLHFEMRQMFRDAGLPATVSGYLGEPALISVHKTTLRKAAPTVPGAWHQDGFFMGPVRSLNMWLSLSRCGDVAPGLDLLPKRLDHYLATATEEAALDYTISQLRVDEAAQAAGTRVIRPIFEPGDALFFDELFLHQTGSDPSMSKPRYAIENWFFAGSAFPAEYAPIAV